MKTRFKTVVIINTCSIKKVAADDERQIVVTSCGHFYCDQCMDNYIHHKNTLTTSSIILEVFIRISTNLDETNINRLNSIQCPVCRFPFEEKKLKIVYTDF